jgi:hypothetical protein
MEPFKDPIAYKKRTTSYDFAAPRKERATTGRFMDAGDNYGVGHTQPVGTEKMSAKSPIPQKAFCFDPDEAIRG